MQQNMVVDGKRVKLQLKGKMYVEEATMLREELQKSITKGCNEVVIDLHELEFIDSSGIGVLVAIHTRLSELGGRVILKGLSGLVLDVFNRTRLIKVFEIVE